MDHHQDKNNPDIIKKLEDRGYSLKSTAYIERLEVFFYMFEYIKTGSKFIHISRPDTENVFAAAFKTVPQDSTGAPHILEHIVLSGSKKYPVKDPFFSMLKRSLNTFMNAFTASDWTMYPFSTENIKDYYNLMDVYLDAAFYPLLDDLSFKQEGWRLDIENEKLNYNGVVYNEMKGNMSDPDHLMADYLIRYLCPDTPYRHESGGDPDEIPCLTVQDLRAFHKRYYHPSNTFFYTYGTFPLIDTLDFIEDKILKNFGKVNPDTDVLPQPRWSEPKKAEFYYPLAKNEDPAKKSQVNLCWLTPDICDGFNVLALKLLGHILIGTHASPLRKALIESNLGSALSSGTGFSDDIKDTMFVCGLKDVRAQDAPKIESIIFDTLNTLLENGIDPELAESAVHQLEFSRKEVTNSPFPYGINLLLSLSGIWFHNGDVLDSIEFDKDIEKIKKLSSQGFFESLIEKYLIKNPHRLLLTMLPDQDMDRAKEKETAEKLSIKQTQMSPADLEKIRQESCLLIKRQESPEDISVLPTLEIEDIRPKIKIVKPVSEKAFPLCYKQPASDILYFCSAFGIQGLEKRLVPLVPFFCYAVTKTGTVQKDYVKLSKVIDRYTGGVFASGKVQRTFGTGKCQPFVAFRGKCLEKNIEKMFEIIEEIIDEFDFSDQKRLNSLLLEYRAGLESSIIRNGSALAVMMASRGFSDTSALRELWGGIHLLKTIKKEHEPLAKDLKNIGMAVLKSRDINTALVGMDGTLLLGEKIINKSPFLSPDTRDTEHKAEIENIEIEPYISDPKISDIEGWHTSSSVCFTGKVFMTASMESEDAPVLAVISSLIKSGFLHKEIREKGGAYGGKADYNLDTGLFSFSSYRDPHILRTIDVYKSAFDYIRSGSYSDTDIKEAILDVSSSIDSPDSPGAAGMRAFYRKLAGIDDATRQRFKDNLLKVNKDKTVSAAKKYFAPDIESKTAVIAGKERLEKISKDTGIKLYEI